MKQTLFTAMCILILTGPLISQSYGHMNLGNMISSMPQTEQANKDLKTYSDELVAQREKMFKEFEANYKVFLEQVNQGNMAPIDQQKGEEALVAEDQKIKDFEQSISGKVDVKRKELLGPIVDQIRQAIEDVAKEKGIRMVFDTSIFNAVLFAEDAVDLTAAVKAKLGI